MWSLAVLAALAASLSPESTIAVRLKASQLDYFMPPPAGDVIRFRIDARQAPPKSGILFTGPVPAGRHLYQIQVLHGRRDRTLVIATPVGAGRSSFEVRVAGEGRLDL